MTNSIQVIHPYKKGSSWVFDDASVGLKAEPFVAGIPEILDASLAAKGIDPKAGFTLYFSENQFPNFDARLDWVKGDVKNKNHTGNWYKVGAGPSGVYGLEGWLCPALFKYFKTAPKTIFVQLKKA